MSGLSPLSENVRRRIEEYVGENAMAVGDRLPSERVLAEHFGVSRASLRMALATLEDAGVITAVQGSGTYLTQLSKDSATEALATMLIENNRDLPEVVPIRTALEGLAARLAAINRKVEDLQVLERAVQGMESAAEAGDQGESYSKDFHFALWNASHNTLLVSQLTGLQSHFNRLREEALAQPQSLAKAITSHRQIFEAIRDSDAERAAEMMERHIVETSQSPLATSTLSMACF